MTIKVSNKDELALHLFRWLLANKDKGQSTELDEHYRISDQYELNRDTKYYGVQEYLRRLMIEPNLEWHIGESSQGNETKVVFGQNREKIQGFFLYTLH